MTLRIRTISRMTGVREGTLRAWERRYGFPRPERSQNNYRSYSREELEAVRRVARLIQDGLSISEAISVVRSVPVADLPFLERISSRFWSAVMTLDTDAAHRVLAEAESAMEPLQCCDELLMPLLRELGTRLDIAREHLASAVIRHRLRGLIQRLEAGEGPRCVLACPPGDLHEGALLSIALHLRSRGWWVSVLGADTPVEAMTAAVDAVKADVLGLSFVRAWEKAELVALLETLLPAIGALVVVGGPGVAVHAQAALAAGAPYASSTDEGGCGLRRRRGLTAQNV